MGPLEICSPTLAPTWPTSKSNQVLRILSRGISSICKDRCDMLPRHPFSSLTSLPGGERKVGWNFPCSYPWPSLPVFSLCTSEEELPDGVFHPPLPILVPVADPVSGWACPALSVAPALDHHSTSPLSSLSPLHTQTLCCSYPPGQLVSWFMCNPLPTRWIPFCMTHIFSHTLHCCVGRISAYILLRVTLDSREVLQSDTGVIWDEWAPPSSCWHSVCK